MSNVTYRATNADGEQSLVVFGSDWQKPVAGSHPNFATLLTYLVSNSEHDEEYVRGLVDPTRVIGKALQEHFGDRLIFDTHHLILDGLPLDGKVAGVVKARLNSGDPNWVRLAKFLVNLEENPSASAKAAVWDWVEKHGVSITEDGRMVGYKGLVNGNDAVTEERNIPVSYHSGPNNFIDGVLYGTAGKNYQVPHRVGTVISKRRADVDDNNRLACSTGLHVGAYSYAKTFGENRADGARYSTMGRMADSLPNSTFALVAFAPQDVVSVPADNTADWKIRVAKYEVLEFLSEVSDVLRDKSSYDHPDKVVVPVKTSAPFLPEGQKVVDQEILVEANPDNDTRLTVEEANEEVAASNADAVEQEVPGDVEWWEIVSEDNLGTTVYETISGTEQDAQEVLEVHDPEGEFGYFYRSTDAPGEDEADEDVVTQPVEDADVEVEDTVQAPVSDEEVSVEVEVRQPSASLTLDLNASLLPTLKADLCDTSKGHKAVARDWEHLTTESSVRRWRKKNGVQPKSALSKALGR